ncbi:hypothetical protein M758_7G071200 [Ceratodon purpureus]|uniref:Secreted protein n=1 Tax=Ceratodon purpureus TaxID=3225 RepID=A0A8T0H8K2_CERPU|nr:hypothetical protein KC19_7G073300 [Ceratodon purpureus]KAG0610500.1 hypothetical protein M758_7G071200 [Ceratodon purpureus]
MQTIGLWCFGTFAFLFIRVSNTLVSRSEPLNLNHRLLRGIKRPKHGIAEIQQIHTRNHQNKSDRNLLLQTRCVTASRLRRAESIVYV